MSATTISSLSGLLSLSELIHDSRRLDLLLDQLIERARALPGVDTVRILLLDRDKGVLVAQRGTFPKSWDDESAVPIGVGFAGRIAQTREPLLVTDLTDFPVHSRALHEAGVRCAVGVPLLAADRLVGVMHIGSREAGTFNADLIPPLQALGRRVAFTVEAIQAELALRESERRFRTLFEDAPVGVFLTGLYGETLGRVLLANRAMERLTGYSAEQLCRMNVVDLLAPTERGVAGSALKRLADGKTSAHTAERRLLRADGSLGWIRGTVSTVAGEGELRYAMSFIEDISDRKDAERELARLALSDPLTGLANRSRVIDHLTLALRQERRTGGFVGLLYLDLDGFKSINDLYGHAVGDRVLQEVAHRLTVAVRAGDTAGRLGGDEFIVVCPNLTRNQELAAIASRLEQIRSDPITVNDRPLTVHFSMGVAIGDRDTRPDELLRRADAAMYEAKRRGRNTWNYYSPALDEAARQRDATEKLLAGALAHDWLRLYYQPVIDLKTGCTVSVEALLRVDHPTQGLITPISFIDYLESSDTGERVEVWVLNEACRQMRRWEGEGLSDLSVNVSGRLATSGHLTETVTQALHNAALDPRWLCLEMTERVIVEGGANVLSDFAQLTAKGVSIAIDDFGIGYSSLTYIQRFPVSAVKIDRSFVAGIGTDPRDDAIVSAVTALGNALRITVIAEGVEHRHQATALREVGCQRAQGFHFGRPQPPEIALRA